MSQYQDSVVILKNASELVLKVEASLEDPRMPGDIIQEMKKNDEDLINLQQELSSLINPLQFKQSNLNKKQKIEEIISDTEKEIEEKTSTNEYREAYSSKNVIEQETIAARQELINETKTYEKIKYEIKDKYAGDREIRKAELKKLDDEYEPKLNNIKSSISNKEKKLARITYVLESIENLKQMLDGKRAELENVEYNLLAAEQSESQDGQQKITDLEQKIEIAKKKKAYLQTELDFSRKAPEPTFIEKDKGPDADDKDVNLKAFIDSISEESSSDYVSPVINNALISKQTSLEKVMQEIENILNSRTNTSNVPIQACISNIDLYERKISKINKQISKEDVTNKTALQQELNKYSVLLNDENNKLDILLSNVPDLQNLLNKRRKIKAELKQIYKAESSELLLKNELVTEKNPKNILDLFKKYYETNKDFYNYLIADIAFDFIINETLYNQNSIEDGIKQFTYNPGDEEINSEHPNRILTPKELQAVSAATVKINDNLVFSFVNKTCRENKELHDIIIQELDILLQDIKNQNRVLQRVNPEDVFAETFLNYPQRGYSRNKAPIIPMKEISSNIKVIVKITTSKLINFIKEFIGDKSYRIQKLEDLLQKEYSHLDPEAAYLERNKIIQQAEADKEKVIKEIQEDNSIPENQKEIVIRKLQQDIDNEAKRRLLLYKEKDPEKIVALKEELEAAIKQRETLSEQKQETEIETQALRIPSSSTLIEAAAESFEYLIKNPGINSVEDNKYFVKLLDASKDIFKVVRASPEPDMYWVKSLVWNRQKTEEFNLQQLSIVFTLQINNDNDKNGTLNVTLALAKEQKSYSFGEVSINIIMDDKGQVSSEITKIISPTIRDQNGNIEKNSTDTIKNTRVMVMIEKAVNKLYKEVSNISKRDFMLIPANKESVINMVSEEFVDYLISIQQLKQSEDKVAIPVCKANFDKLYDQLIPPNKKEARKKILFDIIKMASKSITELS